VYVNNQVVHIYAGMTVRHALLTAGVLEDLKISKKKVYDEWGNEIGLDGVLTEEARIYVREV
ncbi:MAG: hypothetical protein WAV13_09810, partial [Thermodesulfovibrionales bacterium]